MTLIKYQSPLQGLGKGPHGGLSLMFACWWLIALMSADRYTDRNIDRLIDRQTDRKMDRLIDGQTDRETY